MVMLVGASPQTPKIKKHKKRSTGNNKSIHNCQLKSTGQSQHEIKHAIEISLDKSYKLTK